MIQTTFQTQPVFVINDAPNWEQTVESDFTLRRDLQTGLTRREGRRPYSGTLLATLKYTSTVSDDALRVLNKSLRALNTQSVIVPFWPAQTTWANRATNGILGGLLMVWKDDFSQYAIYASTDAEPSWPAAGDNFAPALMGYLTPSEPELMSSRAAKWEVDFTESSPPEFALQPAAFVPDAGPKPTGYATAPPQLPLVPDFSRVIEALKIDVKRETVGFDRETDTEFYPHAAYRTQLADYILTGSQSAQMLRFFLDLAGQGAPFWAPGYLAAAVLTADIGAADTVLQIDSDSALSNGDRLLLSSGQNFARTIVAVGADSITIDSPVGEVLDADLTSVFPLNLARLDKSSISFKWLSGYNVKVELAWTQMPAEELVPGTETVGTTLGKLPPRAVLFQFTRDYGNGTADNWYFTNCEQDLDYGGHTWTHGNFQIGDIPSSLNLEDDVAEITSLISAGNPLNDEVALTSEAPLTAVIYFATLTYAAGSPAFTVNSAVIVFSGDVSAPARSGNKLTMKCRFGKGLFDTQLPIFVRGTLCNHLRGSNADGSHLISAGCTGPDNNLLKSKWKFTATVASPVSAAFPFTVHLAGLARAIGAAPTFFDNWFSNGWIEWGAGNALQRRLIIGSTTPAAGAVAITLHRYFKGLPTVGDAVSIFPGCDGLWTTCGAYDATANPTGRFNNRINFGAEPFTPITNPSLSGQQATGISGSKGK